MSCNFSKAVPGATGFKIEITNPFNQQKWEKKFEPEEASEFNRAVSCCNKSRQAFSPLLATFYPIRTHNGIVFAKDFFLPNVINHAMKIKNIVAKFFAILGALLLDISTFPSRLLTSAPRYSINRKKQALSTYLTANKAPKSLLNTDCVDVRLIQEKGKIQTGGHTDENGNYVPTFSPNLTQERKRVYFHDYPGSFVSTDRVEKG